MLPASTHLDLIIGIDIHIVMVPAPPAPAPIPTPLPHPFIGMVFDIGDLIPKFGATVLINGLYRGCSFTGGMLSTFKHFPMPPGVAFSPKPIGHDSYNFFGSLKVKAEGNLLAVSPFMVMTCNDTGLPLTLAPGKNTKKPIPTTYQPTSMSVPIPAGKPVLVGGPYVPDLAGMLMSLAMSLGMGYLMRYAGRALRNALTRLNNKLKGLLGESNSLSRFLCRHGFEPVNLITGSVLYEGIDFEIPGAIPIKWERTWYSDSKYNGILGHGTHCSYDLSLTIFQEEDGIGVFLKDGRVAFFPLLIANEDKFYNRSEKLTLTCVNKDLYELFDHKNQLTCSFERISKNIFKPVSLSNKGGLAIKFYYNSSRCLKKMVDTAGREIFINLDDSNRVISVEAKHNGQSRKLIEYGYNEAGDLAAITDAAGKTTAILYKNHLMVEKTDRNGQTFYWKYDGHSTGARCIHTWGDGGILEGKIEYKKGYNIVTNSLGESTIYYFDENNLCIQETDPLGNSVFHEYTEFMEPYRDIDPEGNITGYTYDERGNLMSIEKPDGSSVKYMYDESDKLQMISDATGGSTIYVYKDDLLSAAINADKAVTSYEYNDAGLIKTVRNGKGQKTHLYYDKDFNLERITLPDGAEAEWTYDAWGRCTTAINPEKQYQRFRYDELNRVTAIKKYDGNNVSLEYDAYEQVVFAKDEHHRVKFEYTPLGSLKLREENGAKIKFNYNTEDRLISLVNEVNEVYRFAYDSCGKIIKETGFDGVHRNYQRDRAGKVIKIERPGKRFTEYEYDLAGRLTRAEHSDGSWETFSYNRNGQFVEAVNENSSVIFTRDAAGRVIKENQDSYTVESKYDKTGRRTDVKSSLGASVKIERNNAGFVSKMQAGNKEGMNWEAQFKYNALGMETERILPGEIVSSFEYDYGGHPAEHKIRNGSRTIRHRSYLWNVNDRLQNMVNKLNNGTVLYEHDDFGNLAWARYEDFQYDYRLPDKVGNLYRTKEQKDRKYGHGGRLLENKGTKYEYDEEGNLVLKTSPDGKQWKYEWQGNGMLKKVTRPDGKEVCFEYDALGRRTAKIYYSREVKGKEGTITRWVWDGNTPLHEWKYEVNDRPKTVIDEFGEVSKDKPEPAENIITWLFDEGTFKPSAKIEQNKTQSIVTDYLGTPVEMFDANGKQTWSVDYDIYGNIRKQYEGEANDCPFRYQGQYEDEETGLYYNRFRYYNSKDGFYISQDPVGLIGGKPNLYGYTKNTNKWIDPFGLDEIYSGTVYRGMTETSDGPLVYSGPSQNGQNAANSLGVRPGEAGMSTATTPTGMPSHRRPAEFGGTQRNSAMYSIHTDDLERHGLEAVQDGDTHVSIRTREGIDPNELGERLARSRVDWKKVCP